jgi:glycerophosphoryl diester phosphodiesterase
MLNAQSVCERIGHRGAPRERPENTLDGFLLAIERGADAVELDVHMSNDRQVVVHHDDTIDGIPIADIGWSDLETDAAAHVPRLDDVLEAIGDTAAVYIELKGRGIERGVIDVARKHGRRYAMHSFDHAAIERVAELAPDIPRGVLLDKGTANAPGALRRAVQQTRARDAWPHWSLVTEDFIAEARTLGVRVLVWTVNSPDVATRLLDLGVDGICTDDVRILANLF